MLRCRRWTFHLRAATIATLSFLLASCSQADDATPPIRTVDDDRLVAAASDTANWLTYGRTYQEQRHSPLAQIHAGNLDRLALAWYADMVTIRGLEATPLVIDGRMFVTSSWSILYAFDAATGERLWVHDPEVDRAHARYVCCDVVNRGVTAWGDNVYFGTIDGRLLAVSRETGERVWEVQTTPEGKAYAVTGAPRIADGKVLIGNGGAEFAVRGYVSAYDALTGELVWRTYTVPGDPSDGQETEWLEDAARTWSGTWWQAGGGGTAWDAIVYDPEPYSTASSRRPKRVGRTSTRPPSSNRATGGSFSGRSRSASSGTSAATTSYPSFGTGLVVGFLLHNTTEGVGIVAPVARTDVSLGGLVALGAVAGLPTVLGTWIGAFSYAPALTVLFLAVGAGAIVQVVWTLGKLLGSGGAPEGAGTGLAAPLNAFGLLAGLCVMYLTGLIVPA